MTTIESLRSLSDAQLLAETLILSTQEREATARLIAALAALDERRLYLSQGYSSLFAYCTKRLHFAEHAALNRIETARASRAFPIIIDLIADASLTLTAIRLLRPVLTSQNHRALLEEARHKTTRDVEVLVATVQPKPPVVSTIRKLPVLRDVNDRSAGPGERARETAVAAAAVPAPAVAAEPQPIVVVVSLEPPCHRPLVKPLSADTYRLQITMSVATHDKLRSAQALMRHRVPNGDPAVIVDRALDALLRELEKAKFAAAERPRHAREQRRVKGRHIPADVQRAVWTRDEGRCAFASTDGHRCGEMNFIEFHHMRPFARGGAATVENLELRCRAHNAYEAERDFGLFVRETPERVSLLTDAI